MKIGKRVAWLAAGYGLFLFLLTYFADVGRPGALRALGWYDPASGYDQWQYYLMVEAIHGGSLGPFQYPVVYPFLGYLGSFLRPSDPFFFPDLILFGVFVYFSASMLGMVLENAVATLAAAAVLIHASCAMFVKPWTTTVTAAGVAVLLFAYVAGRTSWAWGALCGLTVAAVFGARVGDGVLAGAVLGVFFLDLAHRKTGWNFCAAAVGTGLAAGAIILGVNHHFSHFWLGNYYRAANAQPWCFACIPAKLYGYVVDAYRFQGMADGLTNPLIAVLPLALVAPLGLIFLFLDAAKRRAAWGIAALGAAWMALYGPFHFVSGWSLHFGSLHYTKAMLPVLVACSFVVLVAATRWDARQRKVAAAYAGATAVVLFGIAALTPHPLDLHGIHVSANVNPDGVWDAIDNNPLTRWDTGAPQKAGMEYGIDFERTVILARIDLDSARSPGTNPRGLHILVSTDGKHWTDTLANLGITTNSSERYYFPPVRARQARLVLTQGDPASHWTIYELQAYGW